MNQLKSIAFRMMSERGLAPDFSTAALRQLGTLTEPAMKPEPGVRDLRSLLWCSIDNDTSRDLDQLSVCEPLKDGSTKILVAIADVDALVKRDTPIDEHAAQNTVSVYTAAGVFPMLPERLSTDLTSLNQDEDRYAMVIEMVIDAHGALKSSDIYRGLVRNRAKLAYNAVAAWLDGKGPAPAALVAVPGMDEQVRVQERVAHAMRSLRFQSGALSLNTPQAEAIFDGDALLDLKAAEGNRAKELIEDFMVAANGVVARFLEQKGFPSLRRVLKTPERWPRIVALAREKGFALSPTPDAGALSKFLTDSRAKDPTHFADLSLSVVKLLGRGQYAMHSPHHTTEGHFGLAVNDYTHSTAPNRRFPDLITQRLVKAALAGQPVPYTNDELIALARQCNEQSADAEKVERQVDKAGAAMILRSRIGEVFDGVVTGASDKGTWVRILHPVTEGRLVHGGGGLDVGDRLRVKLVRTDVDHGFIDFSRV